MTEDPFFIEAVAMLVHADLGLLLSKSEPGIVLLIRLDFGGTTRLPKAVLMKDYAEVRLLLDQDRASVLFERNFLGQTELHLAIQDPIMLKCLIENGCSSVIDTEDSNGTTPLRYAVAYN